MDNQKTLHELIRRRLYDYVNSSTVQFLFNQKYYVGNYTYVQLNNGKIMRVDLISYAHYSFCYF